MAVVKQKQKWALLWGTLLFTLVYLYFHHPVPLADIRFDLTNAGFAAEKLVYYLFVVGGSYLTTTGNQLQEDLEMVHQLGFKTRC